MEHIQEDMSKLALDKFYNQIIVISISNTQEDEITTIFNTNEHNLTKEFSEYVDDILIKHHGKIVWSGYNIKNFDIPNLLLKMIKYDTFPIESQDYRYSTFILDNVVDLWDLMGKSGSLVKLCDTLNLSKKYEGLTGKDIQSLYDKGEYEIIKKYSAQDVLIEKELFNKFNKIGGI